TATTTFNIRGTTSLNGGSALLLVDGVETSDLSLLNPQDIESVSVLKDAASASIYGARAAFGVVLITTKTGKKGQKVQINYNDNFSWSRASRLPDGIASDKWVNAMNLANSNSGSGNYFSQSLIDAIHAYMNGTGPSSWAATDNDITAVGEWAYAGNTDWLDMLYKTSFMQQHNVSVSGGSDKVSYYGSFGYKDQDGLYRYGTDTYSRVNIAFNVSAQLTKWLEIGFKTKYNRNKSDTPNVYSYMGSSPHYEIYRSFPYIPMYTANGDWAGLAGTNFNYNTVARLAEAGRIKNSSDDFWYTGNINITPLKGLSIKADFTVNKYYEKENDHYKTLYQTNPDGSTISVGSPNSVTEYRYGSTYYAFNAWADYKVTLGHDHNLGVMAGYNQEMKTTDQISAKTTGLFDNSSNIIDMASTYNLPGYSATTWAVQGVFARINYDYKGKYLVELNGRYDGSSKYAKGDRWAFFPSVSAGWRMSEEPFFEPARPVLNNLKIRASYGSLGNQVTDGNFQYLSFVSNNSLSYVMNGSPITGMAAPTLASNNITWEKVYSTNFGLDFGLFDNRLDGSFDYYIRDTKDMVVSKTYPATLGTSGGKENLANMRTNGWELSITWKDRINNVAGTPFDYSIGLGIADSTSKITKYDNPTYSLNETYYEGMKIGEIWGYVTDGFIKDAAEATEMATRQAYLSATWLPGDIRYKDLNGDGVIDRGSNRVGDSGDRKIIGNNTPRYSFNVNLSFSWKGFDLRLLFTGVMKQDIWLDSPLFWGYYSGIWQACLNDYHVDNSWSEDNQDAYYPVPTWSSRSKQCQTKYLQNGAYLRLKDLTFSYTIPSKLTQKWYLQAVKVYFSAENLCEATGLYKYLDPEVVGIRNTSMSSGTVGSLATDSGGRVYPFTRSYSFGINLTF
ncbi:MAG: TonB-dependent receptor, partial [Bacteroidales bacterium]|nr:TonB-dependent receptor [Bacteroidales bacterium]